MNLGLKMSKYKKLGLQEKVVLHRYRIGTGTIHVLVSGTGTTLDGTGTIWPLQEWYQYHPDLVSVPVAETAQKWQIFPLLLTFLPYSSSTPSYLKNLS